MIPAGEQTGGAVESQVMVSVEEQTGGTAESQAMRILGPLIRFNNSPSEKVRGMKDNLAVMDGITTALATLLHNIVLLWALHQLWHRGFDFTGTISTETWSWWALLSLPVLRLYLSAVLCVSLFIIGLPIGMIIVLVSEFSPLLMIILAIPTGFGGLLIVLFATQYSMQLLGYSRTEILTGWFCELCVLGIVLNLLYQVCWDLFASRPPRTQLGLLDGERAHLLPPNYKLKDEDNEVIAVMAFLGFMATLVLCVVWYQVRFDPAGTCKPGWTDIFGRCALAGFWAGYEDLPHLSKGTSFDDRHSVPGSPDVLILSWSKLSSPSEARLFIEE